MYKALRLDTSEEVLLVGPAWRGRNKELRALTQADLLICQGCRQAVRLKAGLRKRTHFAHKHLQGCAYGGESPRILAARALLYDTLEARFPGQVEVEWRPADDSLPRTVDCLLRIDGAAYPFWLVDTYLKLEVREQIQSAFASLGLSVTWVLLSNLLRPDPNHPAWLLLSPTERAFLCQTAYDQIGREQQLAESDFGATLHYLDEASATLTSYRSLLRVHPPNVFAGRREVSALAQVEFAAPQSPGENLALSHPGEQRALLSSRAQHTRQLERARRWLEPSRGTAAQAPLIAIAPAVTPPPRPDAQVTCVYCGQLTSDWWASWLEAGQPTGKCRSCLDRGLG
jgi:hypothetical protein